MQWHHPSNPQVSAGGTQIAQKIRVDVANFVFISVCRRVNLGFASSCGSVGVHLTEYLCAVFVFPVSNQEEGKKGEEGGGTKCTNVALYITLKPPSPSCFMQSVIFPKCFLMYHLNRFPASLRSVRYWIHQILSRKTKEEQATASSGSRPLN